MVNYRGRGVRLITVEGKELLIPSIQTSLASRLISIIFARILLVKDADAYLAYVMGSSESRKDINQFSIVKVFIKIQFK